MATYTGSDKRLQYLFRASGNLAEDYNDTSTYAVGDFAIVDGVLKKCITAVSTPESYDSTKWTDALITDEMGGGGGGGGTTVIANPVGTPTDDLETIQIGSTIYDIVGGGSSGSGVIKDILWESENGQSFAHNSTYSATLDKNISDYDLLIFSIEGEWANVRADYFALVSNIDKTGTIKFGAIPVYGAISSNHTIFAPSIGYTDETHLSFDTASGSATLKLFKIVGLKFGAGIELASCYSTEERQVGCWTDGKPLYQKTIKVPSSSLTSSETTLAHNIANVDHIYAVDGIALKSGNGSTPITTYHSNSVWACSVYNLSRTNYVFYAGSSLKPYITEIEVTFRYTKTTDTAGSGIWTPSGSYAHHYSTAEQVIGTWTDGSTLYEKTLHIPFSDTSTDGVQRVYSIANALPNTVIRNVFGIATSASYGYCSLGSMCYRQNTQSGTYWQFYWYYNLLALRASDGITSLNNSIKPDIDVTVQYTKAA